ncbi:hypothetical protein DAPPUDRAFT_326201 [Daphnia pulex]|uniref:GA-binding protein alpha subunit N-terminal domain-containing protein n=1 Tax=Daphnia pulex TaxID=6669 RepID=E9H756_DAPPU|nr:hypothetical protein DAPPUDRAFT_326201 [Daphnia pulex]|eukprot:EFX72505.1 hypothetical protein DAPPUDRAFT_326201 [Daphnia pulex]
MDDVFLSEVDLDGHEEWDTLTDETTLSEQCIQGEKLVQVNLELKSVQNIDRINIIDVLKPQQDKDINLNEEEIMEGIKDPEEIKVPVPDPVLEEVSNVALQGVTYQADEY